METSFFSRPVAVWSRRVWLAPFRALGTDLTLNLRFPSRRRRRVLRIRAAGMRAP